QHEHPPHAGGHVDRREVPGGSGGAAREAEAETGRGPARLPAPLVGEDSGSTADNDDGCAAQASAAMNAGCSRSRWTRIAASIVVAGVAIAALIPLRAQVAKADNNITPVYEGWVPN